MLRIEGITLGKRGHLPADTKNLWKSRTSSFVGERLHSPPKNKNMIPLSFFIFLLESI